MPKEVASRYQVSCAGQTWPVGTVYCIGRNYAEHAAELQNPIPDSPVVFLKSAAALRHLSPQPSAGEHFVSAPMAFATEIFHHEAELVLLLGQAVELGEQGRWSDIVGLTLGIDLTRREVQTQLKAKGLPWTTAKSFAGSGILADFQPIAAVANLESIKFTLTVNGELRQTGDSRNMLFPVPTLLTYLASLHALQPGDLVYTGTPKGVGPIRLGDKLVLQLSDANQEFCGEL